MNPQPAMNPSSGEAGNTEDLLITVGLASYNRPQLLARAIESVRAQTWRNLEILVSDNGSTDPRVAKVIEDFAQRDSRVRVMLHPVNRGAAFNFRWLLSQATGDYFIWLADDDYWSEGYLARLLEEARKTGAALTYARGRIVDLDPAPDETLVKEMITTLSVPISLFRFAAFDSDSVFYGLMRTETGQRLNGLLRDWPLPAAWAKEHPFLAYNFVSYPFIYGLLASGGFASAAGDDTVHFLGGRVGFKNSASLGFRHFTLFIAYLLIHLQLMGRFARAAWAAGSLWGVAFAPFAAGWFFLRRIGLVAKQRVTNWMRV